MHQGAGRNLHLRPFLEFQDLRREWITQPDVHQSHENGDGLPDVDRLFDGTICQHLVDADGGHQPATKCQNQKY